MIKASPYGGALICTDGIAGMPGIAGFYFTITLWVAPAVRIM